MSRSIFVALTVATAAIITFTGIQAHQAAAQTSDRDVRVYDFGMDHIHLSNIFNAHGQAAVEELFGPYAINSLARAGIRIDPINREFRDRTHSYMPLMAIERFQGRCESGCIDIIASTHRLLGRGEEVDCSDLCRSSLSIIRVSNDRASPVQRMGLFDSGGYGIAGRVHWLGQSGDTYLLAAHVAQLEGDPESLWDRATLVVVGPTGVLTSDIPLAQNISTHVSTSGPILSRLVRLEGDRLTILYPGHQPDRVIYRVTSNSLRLIEGGIPAEMTRE